MGRKHPKVVTAAKTPGREGEGQQEVEGGDGRASRMRYALPQAVIHLHTDYAERVPMVRSFSWRTR